MSNKKGRVQLSVDELKLLVDLVREKVRDPKTPAGKGEMLAGVMMRLVRARNRFDPQAHHNI